MKRVRSLPRPIVQGLAGASLILVAGCIQVPELDRAITDETRDAPYPELAPVDTPLFTSRPSAEPQEEINTELLSRAEALQERAEALDGPIIDEETRDRMLGAQIE